jgi:riboflavin synthase
LFTGIIEAAGTIEDLREEGTNIHFTIASAISASLKVDQSVSHDGVCLTVVKVNELNHVVTAVEETLTRSNLRRKKIGDPMNLERSMMMNGRLDGHIVQGHVDEIATCKKIEERDGSWLFTFKMESDKNYLVVEKGSIAINGVSLTVINPRKKDFKVTVIPYTFQNTGFGRIEKGEEVNIEYDIIGKYVARMMRKK